MARTLGNWPTKGEKWEVVEGLGCVYVETSRQIVLHIDIFAGKALSQGCGRITVQPVKSTAPPFLPMPKKL